MKVRYIVYSHNYNNTDPQDFGTISNVTFGPQTDTEQCVEIMIVDDSDTEDCERFSFDFISSEDRAVLPSANVVITILDDDREYCRP